MTPRTERRWTEDQITLACAAVLLVALMAGVMAATYVEARWPERLAEH